MNISSFHGGTIPSGAAKKLLRLGRPLQDQNQGYHLVAAFGINCKQSEGVKNLVWSLFLFCLSYHSDNFWINSLCQNSPASSYVVNNLVQCRSFDLLALEVRHGVHEVEPDTALPQLPDEQLLLLWTRDIYKQKKMSKILIIMECWWWRGWNLNFIT